MKKKISKFEKAFLPRIKPKKISWIGKSPGKRKSNPFAVFTKKDMKAFGEFCRDTTVEYCPVCKEKMKLVCPNEWTMDDENAFQTGEEVEQARIISLLDEVPLNLSIYKRQLTKEEILLLTKQYQHYIKKLKAEIQPKSRRKRHRRAEHKW